MIGVKVDTSEFDRLAARVRAAGKDSRAAYAMALNRTKSTARTGMVRSLAKQTGLKQKVTRKALAGGKAATAGSLSADINSVGGNVRLKYFGPRETRKGVSAAPFGARSVFAGTFLKGGRFPNRVPLKLNGQVFKHGAGRKIIVQRSGVVIPAEMVQGATEATFYRVVETELPKRLLHELSRRLT